MHWIPDSISEFDDNRIRMLCTNTVKQIIIIDTENMCSNQFSDDEENLLVCISTSS